MAIVAYTNPVGNIFLIDTAGAQREKMRGEENVEIFYTFKTCVSVPGKN
jgi:hypothetical protein